MFKRMAENQRIRRIRRTGLKGKKEPSSAKRESLAREFFVRTVLLRQFKRLFGKEMKALILVGSAQTGIRKAVNQKTDALSDVDLKIVLTDACWKSSLAKGYSGMVGRFWHKETGQIEADANQRGMRLHLMLTPESSFYERSDEPFQVIYGKEFIEKNVSKEQLQRQPELRRKKLETVAKYKSRE